MALRSVLLLLSDPELRAIAGAVLRDAGFEVVEAADAMAFARAFSAGSFDACVTAWDIGWTRATEVAATVKGARLVLVGSAPPDEAAAAGFGAVVSTTQLSRLPSTIRAVKPSRGLAPLLDDAELPWFVLDDGLVVEASPSMRRLIKGPIEGRSLLHELEVPEGSGRSRVRLGESWFDLVVREHEGGSSALLLDVTEAERLAQDLVEARYDTVDPGLAKENESLRRYAHTVAHDLKSPVRTLLLRLQQLQERLDDPRADTAIDELTAQAERLRRMILDLLPSEATEGVLTDSEAVFDEALDNLDALIDENEAQIERGRLPAVPIPRTELLQVLQNLVGNAVRHSGKGARVNVTATLRDGNHVFSVEDNGPGIPLEDSERIFSAYSQSEASNGGSGLGLAICKRLVEERGGWIWVDSSGQGSTFQFGLPAR
ncbi:MAG: HAMP domain-containing histidine kinase [Proteobacteria bacterium]|nr:HAMP domain-containing histidine kinase [Pseudomonadota bacterium]